MKKRIRTVFLVVMFCFFAAVPAYAQESRIDGFAEEYFRLMDQAELLTDKEERRLLSILDEISERQKFEVVIVTVTDTNGDTVQDCADDLYDHCNFGYGPNRDGALLLISMKDRDWYITTSGYGITALTDAGIAYIGEQIKENLSDGDYADAFRTYAEQCDLFVTQARTGKPFDNSNLPRPFLSWIWIPISIAAGFVVAFLIVSCMKSKLKTVRTQASANHYVRDGSMNVTECRDRFLYHQVNRIAKPEKKSSGSSTHTSSSGRTHGGGGGKF